MPPKKPRKVFTFDGFPLQSVVDLLAKAGVEKYDKDVLQAVSNYVRGYTGKYLNNTVY
jgi:ABC-type enterochelin transport system substrate-binding protein